MSVLPSAFRGQFVSYVSTVFGILFIIALPVVLVASNIRLAFNSLSLYESGFTRHDVTVTTGLSETQLRAAAIQIRDYFNSDDAQLIILIDTEAGPRELFDQRETKHMSDVKDLVSGVYRIQEGALLLILLFTSLGFLFRGSEFAPTLSMLLTYGSAVTLILVVTVSLVSLVAFNSVFTLFHEVSFANDFWLLDPKTSFLVRMFPFDFWLEATIILAIGSVVEVGAIVTLIAIIRSWQRRRAKIAASRIPRYI